MTCPSGLLSTRRYNKLRNALFTHLQRSPPFIQVRLEWNLPSQEHLLTHQRHRLDFLLDDQLFGPLPMGFDVTIMSPDNRGYTTKAGKCGGRAATAAANAKVTTSITVMGLRVSIGVGAQILWPTPIRARQ